MRWRRTGRSQGQKVCTAELMMQKKRWFRRLTRMDRRESEIRVGGCSRPEKGIFIPRTGGRQRTAAARRESPKSPRGKCYSAFEGLRRARAASAMPRPTTPEELLGIPGAGSGPKERGRKGSGSKITEALCREEAPCFKKKKKNRRDKPNARVRSDSASRGRTKREHNDAAGG